MRPSPRSGHAEVRHLRLARRLAPRPGRDVGAASQDARVCRPGRVLRLSPGRASRHTALHGALAQPLLHGAGPAYAPAALRPDGVSAPHVPSDPADGGDLHPRSDQRRAPGARRRPAGLAVRGRHVRHRHDGGARGGARGAGRAHGGPGQRRGQLRGQVLPHQGCEARSPSPAAAVSAALVPDGQSRLPAVDRRAQLQPHDAVPLLDSGPGGRSPPPLRREARRPGESPRPLQRSRGPAPLRLRHPDLRRRHGRGGAPRGAGSARGLLRELQLPLGATRRSRAPRGARQLRDLRQPGTHDLRLPGDGARHPPAVPGRHRRQLSGWGLRLRRAHGLHLFTTEVKPRLAGRS